MFKYRNSISIIKIDGFTWEGFIHVSIVIVQYATCLDQYCLSVCLSLYDDNAA